MSASVSSAIFSNFSGGLQVCKVAARLQRPAETEADRQDHQPPPRHPHPLPPGGASHCKCHRVVVSPKLVIISVIFLVRN